MAVSVDVLTLDNFESKMPKWNPADSNHLYALVDMGSNGIRFSISDLSPPRARLLKCIYRERAGIALFDALNSSTGAPLTFPLETIALVSAILARFRSIAVDDFGVPPQNVTVFATEAMRRTENAASMLTAIHDAADGLLDVKILAPEVETLFGAVGARSGFVDVKGLFLDLGGGSVQMTYMDTYAARRAEAATVGDESYEVTAARAGQSLPFGAARLIRVLETADAEVQSAEKSKLQQGMREAFENLRRRFDSLAETVAKVHEDPSVNEGIDIYLCGGGFRGYGSMLMHNDPISPYPVPSIRTYVVSGTFFGKTKQMAQFNREYEGKIFGMSKRRRAQFPAIVTVVEALIDAVPKIRSVTFCTGGNREGALMTKFPRDIRESNPLDCLYNLSSEEEDVMQAVMETLKASLPTTDSLNVFNLGLGPLFAHRIWKDVGENGDTNASAALHDAIARDASCPGLTHLARAVLGLTLCSRWCGTLGPTDQRIYQGLQALVQQVDADAIFWANYIGAVAAAIVTVVPAWPRIPERLLNTINLSSTIDDNGKKDKIVLTVTLSSETTKGVNIQEFEDLFKGLGKAGKNDNKDKTKKVKVQIQQVPRVSEL